MFNLGDRVKSDYHTEEKNIVRTITGIEVDPICSSGFAASAKSKDGVNGQDIIRVDADWFCLVAENKTKKDEIILNLSNLFEGLDIENLDAADFVDRAGDIIELVNKANEIKSLEEK